MCYINILPWTITTGISDVLGNIHFIINEPIMGAEFVHTHSAQTHIYFNIYLLINFNGKTRL